MNYLTFEVDNKSSVVVGILPYLTHEPDAKIDVKSHAYVVMDQEHKAIKFYDPRCHAAYWVSNQKLTRSLIKSANASKEELCVSIEQLEKRKLQVYSLHSNDMYKSVHNIKGKIQ